jgi:hypothetical protein
MPKAPMHEYAFALFGEDNVRGTRQLRYVQCIPIPFCKEQPAHR